MTLLQAIVLGVVQGITEFLPVSSSAHLVLAPYFFGWRIPPEQTFPFDVLVQLGTLAAVFAYFWKDIFNIVAAMLHGVQQRKPLAEPQARLGWHILLASVPAGLIGLLLKDRVEAAFLSPAATAVFLLVTAALLLLAEALGSRQRSMEHLNWKDALWIGLAQALAIFPGVSRSGATIAGGMTRGLQRRDAGRFSFLMSIPIMLAAGLLSLLDLPAGLASGGYLAALLAGFLTAAVVGLLSIHWLLGFLSRHSLKVFAYYCLVLGLATLLMIYVV